MRPRLALALVALFATSSACIIDQDLGEWPCQTPLECDEGHFCVDGFCTDQPIVVCNDADGDETPLGPDCTIPVEEQDCDDADPNIEPGAPELCNNTDDDCDGEIDEDIAAIACPLTEGVCAGVMTTCVAGMPAECDYGADYVSEEGGPQCGDGLDNDCDGDADAADDNCPDCVDGAPCAQNNTCLAPTTPEQCACKPGTTVCDGGTERCVDVEGNPVVFPGTPEVCGNGIDDDCFLGVDNGCP